MMVTKFGFRLLFVAWLAWPFAATARPASVTWQLAPQSAPLPEAGIPRLHEEVAEATGYGDELQLRPIAPHDWLRDADDDRPFRMRAMVHERFDHGVLTVWNWRNEPLRQVRIAPGALRGVDLQVDGLGSYLLTLDGFDSGQCRRRLARNVAVTEDLNTAREAFRTDEFFLGICAFPGRYHWRPGGEPALPPGLSEEAARELEAKRLARLGFQVARIDESMEMGRREGAEGGAPYRFDFERMDAAAAAYTSRGFELALQVMHAPDWAIHPDYAHVEERRWRYPRAETPQRAYVAALLERYGEHARFVQVFNEPDQAKFWAGTSREYVEQFRYTHEEIRAHSASLPVANGGYAFVDEERVAFYVDRLRPWIDRPAYHSHGSLPDLRETFGKMKTLHRAAGYEAPAFLNTETGFDAWRLDQERRQAQALIQKTLYGWANDHRGVMLFCGRMVKGPGREGRDLGLLTYAFCPRFAYAAVGGLVSALAGASHEATLVQTDETFVHRFRRGEDRIVAAFCLGGEKEITLRSDGVGAIVVGPMGNRRQLDSAAQVTLRLDGDPRYVIFEGAGSVELGD